MERVNANDLPFRSGDSGVKYLFRGPSIDWGLLRLKPGEALGHHYHERVEETFYFPSSAPKIIVNGVEHRVRPGDAFRLAPPDRHDILNDTPEPVDIIFIKSSYDPKDKVDVR